MNENIENSENVNDESIETPVEDVTEMGQADLPEDISQTADSEAESPEAEHPLFDFLKEVLGGGIHVVNGEPHAGDCDGNCHDDEDEGIAPRDEVPTTIRAVRAARVGPSKKGAQFEITRIGVNQYLFEGVDFRGNAGSALLDATKYLEIDEINFRKAQEQRADDAIEEFHAPLNNALKFLEEETAMFEKENVNPLAKIIVTPEVKGVEAVAEETFTLDNDGTLLRIVMGVLTGGDDRHLDSILWVDNATPVVTF